jgi:DNA-binding LacI/PurR family transcriptional regulator
MRKPENKEDLDMKKTVTLKTIAEELGVSVTAVSKAMRGEGSISRELTAKIKKLAEEMNYQPNSIASSLRTRRTQTLGLVISDSTLSLFAPLIEGIEKTAAEMGYNIILCNAHSSVEKEKEAVRTLVNKRIDGLFLAASLLTSKKDKEFLDSFEIPYMFLVRRCDWDGGDFVINDNAEGTYQMIDYLVKSGSDKIFFINISNTITTYRERLRGYREALTANKIRYDEKIVSNVKPTYEEGYHAMNKILMKEGANNVRAVFCGCDMIAVGAMERILEEGLKIPGDVRLASYDDIEFAAHLRVPLTTVRQPTYKIGRLGAEKLIDKIQNQSESRINMVIKPELVLRQST